MTISFFKSRLFSILAILFCAVAFCACSDDDDNDDNNGGSANTEVLNNTTWEINVGGENISTITFTNKKMTMDGQEYTYTINDDDLTIKLQGVTVYCAEIDDNTMELWAAADTNQAAVLLYVCTNPNFSID